ncbi:MAG: hypothetical protein M3133_08055, partial [Actinomycetota bacterium]|nr:hypothetical protein [Actinomycetota bacterium]
MQVAGIDLRRRERENGEGATNSVSARLFEPRRPVTAARRQPAAAPRLARSRAIPTAIPVRAAQ